MNQRGFTMIEVVIGSALVVTATFAIYSASLFTIKQGLKVERRSQFERIARILLQNISDKGLRYPGMLADSRFDNPTFQPFDDPTIADLTCFTKDGIETKPTNSDCLYNVSWYQLQQTDTEFASNNDMRPLPLYRLFIRIRYVENGQNKEFFISQFLTPGLWQ